MEPANISIQPRFVNALGTQASYKPRKNLATALLCPYPGHNGRIFNSINQLLDHAKTDHAEYFGDLSPDEARRKLAKDAR
jgi:hypothetical protein